VIARCVATTSFIATYEPINIAHDFPEATSGQPEDTASRSGEQNVKAVRALALTPPQIWKERGGRITSAIPSTRSMQNTTLLSPPDWWELGLVGKLTTEYKASLKRVYNFLLPLIKTRPLGSEEFTDHDLSHSTRIIERIEKILPEGAELNQPELYILLLSALLHDVGMWIPRRRAFELLEDEEFLAFCQRYHPRELPEVQSCLKSAARTWMGELGLQRLAAAYARDRHARRSAELLLVEAPDGQHEALRTLIDPAFLLAVALVSEAHSWERRRVLEDPELRPREIGRELINFRFLAELLRLGDLLDLGEGRVSLLLWHYLRPFDATSEAHWRKEATLRLDRCEPDLIEVSGTFNINRDGILAADAFTLANDWLQWLQDEINGCAIPLQLRQEPSLSKRCFFGKLVLNRDGVKALGLVLGGTVGFHLDGDKVMELLGTEIYVQGSVFVRELIQNAIDATRAQIVRDASKIAENRLLPQDAPWDWPREIVGRPQYAIEVTTGSEIIGDKRFDRFLICDRGIGMTLQQLSDYLLQIGRSYYRTSQFLKEFSYPSISRFGIGFVSCLIADRIEIVTRAHPEAAGLLLTLKKPSKQFTVTRADNAEFGTKVTLWIDAERARADGWDRLPSSPKDGGQEFYLQEVENAGGATVYSTAARLWCLWTEMPVIVDGAHWGPRSVRKEPRVLNRRGANPHILLERRWYPFLVRAANGEIAAEANLGVFALPSNALPIFPDYCSSFEEYITNLVSVRGIWLMNQRGYAGLDYQLNINFLRTPRNTLSASRAPRGSQLSDAVSAIGKTAILKLLHYTFDYLLRTNPAAAAFWRLPIELNKQEDLPPLILPYRTNSEAGWTSEEELIERFERFVLVPMMLAIEGPWNHGVPCVGYMYPRIHRKLDKLSACTLVAVENTCTGLLYPPRSRLNGLEPFNGTMTRTALGTYIWKPSHEGIRTSDSGISMEHGFNSRDVIDNAELRASISPPPYEARGRNPWYEMGLHPSALWSDKEGWTQAPHSQDVYSKMRSVVSAVAPIAYPPDLLDLTYVGLDEDWE
jgi:hypothetical protein